MWRTERKELMRKCRRGPHRTVWSVAFIRAMRTQQAALYRQRASSRGYPMLCQPAVLLLYVWVWMLYLHGWILFTCTPGATEAKEAIRSSE